MKNNYILLLILTPFLLIAQSESPIIPINSTISYKGYGETIAHYGTGEYKIYYDTVDEVLDKPLIFVDGFDPGDSRTISTMYSSLNYPGGNLADIVRSEGYDLIVLNFPTYISSSDGTTVIDGGADFIQRNAFILVELLKTINAMKEVGSDQNVVIGPSMGGLISRYALRYMEQQSMTHDTRLFISFDSPHRGANIPISIQYTFSYLVNGLGQSDAQSGLNTINSAAAKQMLLDHYLGHVDTDGYSLITPNVTLPTGAPNFRDAFQTEIDAMGLPQTVRNVGIINGSGISALTGSPGANIINHLFDLGSGTSLNLNLNFTPSAAQTYTVTSISGLIYGFIPFNYSAPSESPSTSDGLDSAPGGTASLSNLDDGTSAILTEFVTNLNQSEYNFIPTLSALDIIDDNWYVTPNLSSSPFANTYLPNINEGHVMLTDENVAFTLSEIRQTLSLEDIANNTFKLAKNPVENTLTLLSANTFENSKLSIVDIMGNTVFNTVKTINSRTEISLNLATGLYILNIETLNNLNYRTKIIVK